MTDTAIPNNVTVTWTPATGWVMTETAPGPEPKPPPTGIKAGRIADLLERFGTNTFCSTSSDSNVWGAWPADYSQESVIAGINFFCEGTGLTMRTREYHYSGRETWQEPWCVAVHQATGSMFTLAPGAGGGVGDASSIVAMAARSASSADPWVRMVEGVNEPNTDFGSGTVPQQTVLDAQYILATAPSSVLVAGPSIVFGLPYPEGYITPGYLSASQMADLKGSFSVSNGHLYPPKETDLDDGSTRGGIMRDTVAGLRVAYGDKPITYTEWHPTLFLGDGAHRLDPVLDAYYAACFILSAYREGITDYYWYPMIDYGSVYLSGLFPRTGGVDPRPCANTIQAMFRLTGDLGSDKRTFETGHLDYTIEGLAVVPNLPNAGGQHALFQNSAGTFFLFVWNAQAQPEGATSPVTARFGEPVTLVEDFQVSSATEPTAMLQSLSHASEIVIPLDGSVHLLRITIEKKGNGMTTINPGDALNLDGGQRTLDMTMLRAAVTDKSLWQTWDREVPEADISNETKWVHGYADTWGSGRVDWQTELLLYWAKIAGCAIPNVNALNDLGSTPFSLGPTGNVLALIRKLTAAEKETMQSSNANALQGVELMGAAICTHPYGLEPPFYYSATMKIPDFHGAWPAVWLLPSDRSWPPEFDVLEGSLDPYQGSKLTTSIHSDTKGYTDQVVPTPIYINPDVTCSAYVPWPDGKNPTTSFIEYGYLVYPGCIATFYDGMCVQVAPLPSDCNRRWYALIDSDVYQGTNPDTHFTPLEIHDVSMWKMPREYGTGGATPPDPSTDHVLTDENYKATIDALDQAAVAIEAAKAYLG